VKSLGALHHPERDRPPLAGASLRDGRVREGVYLRGYAQKDPLIEYKTEAFDMFVELMSNIKNEVLHNLFRSTSNLQAFENFLSTLPQFLLKEQAPSAATATGRFQDGMASASRR